MLSRIKNLSERSKKFFAFTVSGIVTLSLFGAWLLFGTPRLFDSYQAKQKVATEQADKTSFVETLTEYGAYAREAVVHSMKNIGTALNATVFKKELEYKSE